MRLKSLQQWREEKGLADFRVQDQGPPKIKNKTLRDKYKIPDVPAFTFTQDRGIANKVDV